MRTVWVMGWTMGSIAGCGVGGGAGDGRDGCAPGGEPTLTVGTGSGAFEALAEGDRWPLVYGPQGGVHLDVGLQAVDLDLDDLVAGQLEAEVDSRIVASSEPWLDFRCTGDSLESWGTRLIFDVDLGDVEAELADQEVVVRADLTDRQGTSVSGEGTFIIDNPRR